MELKKPTTFDEQIEILKSRNLTVEDEEFAKKFLSSVNYYKFTGYMYTFKDANGNYKKLTFNTTYDIYLFDKRFKNILLYAIELTEENIKAHMSYTLAHKLGALSYKDPSNFTDAAEHSRLISKFDKTVAMNKNLLFVKHHISQYDGKFPIWVAVELFTWGMLWNMYKYLKTPLKKNIAANFNVGSKYLESWIECITYLRNQVAHDMRLYRVQMQKTPKKSVKHNNLPASNRVFDILYVMRFLSPDTSEWNDYVVYSLSELFKKYRENILLSDYGFPPDWESILPK